MRGSQNLLVIATVVVSAVFLALTYMGLIAYSGTGPGDKHVCEERAMKKDCHKARH